jgi:PqqD family protein of HPr-rel-A system
MHATGVEETAIRLPEHVVFRAFPTETVVLNLQSGKYHGLNPSAGRMLELLDASGSLASATAAAADEYGQDPEQVERDIRLLCRELLERGLIEVDGDLRI